MDSPLVYLTLCSMRNRLRVRLRRLREPRYLIGSVVGVVYFALVFGRPFSRRTGGGPSGFLNLIGYSDVAIAVTAVFMLAFIALAWLWPSSRRPALAFTRADVQFLFTAPITRRRLVRYKVLRSQLSAFFGSAALTLIMRPGSVAQAWTFFAGFALTMAVINLHLTGISLTRVPAGTPGVDVTRRWLPRAIVVLGLAVVGVDLVRRWPDVSAIAASGGNVVSELARILSSGASGIVLWPFAQLARLPLAGSSAAFAMALPWTIVAIWLNYLWVLRTDVPFEEASAELSEKMARVRTEGVRALRKPRRVTTPFQLASVGALEIGILWKNLISMGRFLSWTTLLRFFPIVIFLTVLLARGGRGTSTTRADTFAFLTLMNAGVIVWLGPQLVRADLRQDLPNLAVLRTWPMRGATLVRGEVLAPAIVLVVFAWVTLIAAAIFSTHGSARFQIPNVWATLIGAMAVTPGLILVQLLVQNALAVTFPSWVAIGPPRGGVDVMGQRLLLMFGSILALVVAVLPPALVAGAVLFAVSSLGSLTGSLPIVLPALVAAVALLGEAFLGSELIGLILDRTDVTALDPADT